MHKRPIYLVLYESQRKIFNWDRSGGLSGPRLDHIFQSMSFKTFLRPIDLALYEYLRKIFNSPRSGGLSGPRLDHIFHSMSLEAFPTKLNEWRV